MFAGRVVIKPLVVVCESRPVLSFGWLLRFNTQSQLAVACRQCPSKNPQAAADGPSMAKAAAACGVLRFNIGLSLSLR